MKTVKGWPRYLIAFLPVLAIISLFYFYPLYVTLERSMLRGEDFIGLERYADFLSDATFLHAFTTSLRISLISTAVSIILGVAIALALRGTFAGKRVSLFLFQMNISIPHIAMATMVVFLLGSVGIVSSIAYQMGWISNWTDFPKMIHDVSPFGIVVAYSLKFIPFIGMAVLAVLQAFPAEYEQQSRSLGVGRLRTFFHVTLPAIVPAIATSSMIVFAFSFGCYEVPSILLHDVTVPTLIYNSFYDFYDPEGRPTGYAAAIMLTVLMTSIAAVYLYLTSRGRRA